MKKVLNMLIALVLVVMTVLLVVVIVENKKIKDKYYEAMDNCISATDKATEYENMYNSMLESFTSESATKVEIENDYKELEEKYDTLLADYNELQSLYNEETAVHYEDPADLSEYATDITYDNLARTPDDYEGKAVKLYGKVIQLIEGGEETQIRLAIDGDYDKIILIGYNPKIVSERVLEDDYITIYGISMGIFTYESTMGGMISVPGVYVEHIERN